MPIEVACPRCGSGDVDRHCKTCADAICLACKAHWDPTKRPDGSVRCTVPIPKENR